MYIEIRGRLSVCLFSVDMNVNRQITMKRTFVSPFDDFRSGPCTSVEMSEELQRNGFCFFDQKSCGIHDHTPYGLLVSNNSENHLRNSASSYIRFMLICRMCRRKLDDNFCFNWKTFNAWSDPIYHFKTDPSTYKYIPTDLIVCGNLSVVRVLSVCRRLCVRVVERKIASLFQILGWCTKTYFCKRDMPWQKGT